MMLKDILFVLWFFLPAGLASMTPVFAAKWPLLRALDFPLDGYMTFRGRRVFGSHKTVRGLFSSIAVGVLTVYLQVGLFVAFPLLRSFISLDYTTINPWLLGLLASLGALGGDAARSFFKRQLDIAPARAGFPLTSSIISSAVSR
ncbi:MAG TPA: CDP-archaeol synthase [Ktedonobacteraceae bacterium]|nr:CDP-archaeol synthase [Ktedonobacteraceae bacterium]